MTFIKLRCQKCGERAEARCDREMIMHLLKGGVGKVKCKGCGEEIRCQIKKPTTPSKGARLLKRLERGELAQ